MSLLIGSFGQCFCNTCWQKGSISQNATVSMPARSKPREKPPMPENKSSTFSLFGMAFSLQLKFQSS
jgi:hypothetical protein